MNWGQIRRHIVQTVAPDLPLPLVNDYINFAYEEILESQNWQGKEVSGSIAIPAEYVDGTVDVAQGDDTVIGTGTTWTEAMSGRRIWFSGVNQTYVITWVSATELTLDRPFETADLDDAGYWIRAWSAELNELSEAITVMSTSTGHRVEQTERAELEKKDPARTQSAETPWYWSYIDDVPNSVASPRSIRKIEFWPAATLGHSLLYTARETPIGCSDDSLTLAPLAWVPERAIISRAKAHVLSNHPQLESGQLRAGSVDMFMAEFSKAMRDLTAQESARLGPTTLRPVTRYANPLSELL